MTLEEAREQFLAARKNGIGGSDCHHLFNLEPYGCRRQLYYDKTDTPSDYLRVETEPMERGTAMEAVIAEKYMRDNPGVSLRSGPMARHPEHQWATVNVDRWVYGLDRFGESSSATMAEIKCPGREAYYRVVRNGLPEAYILQAQHGMLVTGAQACLFIVFNADLWRWVDFTVDRDEQIIKRIEAQGEGFWRQVELREPPPRLDSKSPQCRRCAWRTTCQGEAMLLNIEESSRKEGEEIPVDVKLADLCSQWAEVDEMKRDAEALLDALKAQISAAMGTRTAVDAPGFRVYHRPQETNRINTDKVNAAAKAVERELTGLLASATNGTLTLDGLTAVCDQIAAALKKENLTAKSVSRPLRIYAR